MPAPESMPETVEQSISRALEQRPDLQAQFSGIDGAKAERQQARADFYPSLSIRAAPDAQSLYAGSRHFLGGTLPI